MRAALVIPLMVALLAGCGASPAAGKGKPEPAGNEPPKKDEVAAPAGGGPIFGQKTRDIGVIGKDDKEADTTITGVDPVSTSLQGYTRAISEIAKIQVKQAVDIFNALEGRYPKDYKEFKEKIIDANNIDLPKLPHNLRYAYDEKTHELKIIEVPRENAAKKGA
jgi:hypothetical protein